MMDSLVERKTELAMITEYWAVIGYECDVM